MSVLWILGIGLVVSIIVLVLGALLSDSSWGDVLGIIMLMLGGLATAIFAIVFVVVAVETYEGKIKAQILNREYGTNYTADEITWGEDVVDKVLELQRQRIELTITEGTKK